MSGVPVRSPFHPDKSTMEKQRKWVFIVNPVAGNGFALTLVDQIRQLIAIHRLDADIVITERKGHATEFVGALVPTTGIIALLASAAMGP